MAVAHHTYTAKGVGTETSGIRSNDSCLSLDPARSMRLRQLDWSHELGLGTLVFSRAEELAQNLVFDVQLAWVMLDARGSGWAAV
jgi:hypothetical protein